MYRIMKRLWSSAANASGSKLPFRWYRLGWRAPEGSAITRLVDVRAAGVHGLLPAGSGAIRATSCPSSETTRMASCPVMFVDDARAPEEARRAWSTVPPLAGVAENSIDQSARAGTPAAENRTDPVVGSIAVTPFGVPSTTTWVEVRSAGDVEAPTAPWRTGWVQAASIATDPSRSTDDLVRISSSLPANERRRGVVAYASNELRPERGKGSRPATRARRVTADPSAAYAGRWAGPVAAARSVLPSSTPFAKYVPVGPDGRRSYVATSAYATSAAPTTTLPSSRSPGLRPPTRRPSAVG